MFWGRNSITILCGSLSTPDSVSSDVYQGGRDPRLLTASVFSGVFGQARNKSIIIISRLYPSRIEIEDSEAVGISNIISNMITMFPRSTLTALPTDLFTSFINCLTLLTCSFGRSAALEEVVSLTALRLQRAFKFWFRSAKTDSVVHLRIRVFVSWTRTTWSTWRPTTSFWSLGWRSSRTTSISLEAVLCSPPSRSSTRTSSVTWLLPTEPGTWWAFVRPCTRLRVWLLLVT